MKISFKTKKLEKLFNSEAELNKKFGKKCAVKIIRRLSVLQSAETLQDLRSLPGRCHELRGERRYQLSLDLDHPLRLIF